MLKFWDPLCFGKLLLGPGAVFMLLSKLSLQSDTRAQSSQKTAEPRNETSKSKYFSGGMGLGSEVFKSSLEKKKKKRKIKTWTATFEFQVLIKILSIR